MSLLRFFKIQGNTSNNVAEVTSANAVKVDGSGTVQPISNTSLSSIDSKTLLPNLDAFGSLRVSNRTTVFDAQLTYDLQPLLFEQIITGTGGTITHDATNRNAIISLTSSSVNANVQMQSFEHIRYQPSKSQLVFVTFNMGSAVAGCRKFVGLGTFAQNGFHFRQNTNGVLSFEILSQTTNGMQTAVQSNWSLDKLDGTGASGITLDITKTQILVIDFQALYVGKVRFGFSIDGKIVYAHEFKHANLAQHPYVQSANLPIICGMRAVSTVVTASMNFICSAVVSEGGQELTGYDFSQASGTVNIASGVDTHILSIQPSLLFNAITNRAKFIDFEFEINVVGNNPIDFKLGIGQVLTGTTAFNNVNATYSAMDFNILGTLSGSPAIIIDQGSIFANATVKNATTKKVQFRYPITLDNAGAVRTLGRITLIGAGIGGTTQAKAVLKWREIR